MNERRKPRVLLVAHNSGTAFWRVKNPLESLRDMDVAEMCWVQPEQVPMRDRYWMENWDIIVFHQSWQDQCVILTRLWKSLGKKIILSVDDLINGFKIPNFITGGMAYREREATYNIHEMMTLADRIVTTQPFLSECLSKFFEIPMTKFMCYPNLPNYNWLGKMFDPQRKLMRFKQRRGALRIGVISSLSHYKFSGSGSQGGKDIPDDLEIVVETAKNLKERKIDNLTWVLPIGEDKALTERLSPYANFVTSAQSPIRDYPMMLSRLDLDLVVVPLQKCDFNDCKSNIKLLECAALAIPVLVSDAYPYRGFIDKDYMFSSPKELADKITNVRSWSDKRYGNLIMDNYRRFYESECDYYGQKINTYWLEQNVPITLKTFLNFDIGADSIVPPDIKQEV